MENRFGLKAVDNQNEFTEQAIEPKRQFETQLDTPLTMGEYNALNNIYQNSDDKERDVIRFGQALEYKRNFGIDIDYAFNNLPSLNEMRGIPQEYNWSTFSAIKNSFKISALNDKLADLNSQWMDADMAGSDLTELEKQIADTENQIEGLRDYAPRSLLTNMMKWAGESSVFTGVTMLDSLTYGAGTALTLAGFAALMGAPITATAIGGAMTWAGISSLSAGMAKLGGTISVANKTKGTMYRELRKQGVEKNLAKSASSINGYVNGLIETSLGVVPAGVGSVLKATGVEQLTATTMARLAMRGTWGAMGKMLANHVVDSVEEGEEEFLQSLTDDITDAIVLTMSEECQKNGVTFDKSVRDVVTDAIKAGGQGFGAALIMSVPSTAVNTRIGVKAAKQLKAEAKINPSEESFVRNHMNDSAFEGVDKKDVKEMLREMYQNQNEVPADERIDESTIDSDTIEENVDIESEEDEAAVASEAPEKDIERMENGRLRTQEEKDYDVDIEGNEKHTLKVGTPNSSTRYGRVEYTVRKDGSIEIDKVATKAGYAKSVTKDAVLELMRRYAGQDVVWNPTNAYQQKIKTELESENNGTLQRFKSQYNQSEEAELGDYLHEKYKQITPTQGKILYKLYDNIAKAYGSTIHEMIQDARSGNPKSALRFATMAEGVKSGAIKAENARGKRGAVDYANRIIYVGEHGDITTLFHEGFHILTKVDKEGAKNLVKSILESKELEGYIKSHRAFFVPQLSMTTEEIMKALSNLSEDSAEWTEDQDEILTSLFEAYLRNGKTFSKELENIFSRIADFFIQIYKTLAGGKHLSDDIIKAFDQILEGNPELKAKYEAQEGTRFQSPTTEERAEATRQYNEVVAKYKGTDQWLKAPNGQPTNLTERQWVQVRTPNFKAWFGDWENDPDNASKVVDENGEPKVVYHGTDQPFDVFRIGKGGYYSYALYFTENKEEADKWGGYADYTKAVFLNIRNMNHIGSKDDMSNDLGKRQGEIYKRRDISPFIPFNERMQQINREFTEQTGIDGFDVDYKGWYIALQPEQIKSATDNVGTFSQSNPSILFQTDFQERVIAAQDFRDEAKDYGHRVKINWDGSITLYHGTSKENADSIQANGINAQSYFGYSEKEAEYYAKKKYKDGVVIKVAVDPRDIEFAAAGAEIYTPNELKFRNGMYTSQPDNSHTNLLFQSAYHGSGASFDKFDTDFMGTGEGAQAFGWGIYLTQSEGIARDYAERMGGKHRGYYGYYGDYEFLSDGKPISQQATEILNKFNFITEAENNNQSEIRKKIRSIIEESKEEIEDKEKTIKFLLDEVIKIEDNPSMTLGEYIRIAPSYKEIGDSLDSLVEVVLNKDSRRENMPAQKMADYLETIIELSENRKNALTERINVLSELDLDKVTIAKGLPHRNLYTVSIPDDTGSNYLYWDRPIGEEALEKIRNAYIPELVERNQDWLKKGTKEQIVQRVKSSYAFNSELASSEETGKQIYNDLIKLLGSDKDASEFLNRAGFVGIDYPANSMSGGNKYGKRNFVIFNADDINIQTHIRYQNRLTEDERSQLVEEARDFDTFDDFLNYLSIMNGWLEPSQYTDALPVLDEIYSEAHGITRDKQKVELDLSGMTDDQKDRAFEQYIDGDGIKVIMSLLHDMYTTHYGYTYAHGALEDEEIAEEESLMARIREFEDNASSFIYNLAKSKKELTDKQFNSIRNVIKKNTRMYRELIADTLESETLRSDAEPDIAGVRSEGRPTLADRETLEKDAKVTLDDKVEGEIEKKLTEVESELDKDEKAARALEGEIDSLMGELKGELTEEEQKALKELKYLDRLAGRKDELAEALKKKIDNGEAISQAENTRLDNLAKQIKELEKALDNFNTKQKAKNYIDKQNALKKLRKEIREKQKQKRALKELHEYKGRLVKYLQKKVPKSVAYEYKGMIEAIISMFSDVSGYDNNITYRGKSLTPKEFREAVDRDGSLDELSKYYIRRYEKKSLADYTVEELEHMADVKRRLVDVGRQMWQAKVDARNAEAAQIRQIILNHLRQSPKFSTAPLPDTQEDKKAKKTFRKKFNELFTRTIPMSRITQMLDGNQKGFVYELLTRDKRLVQDMERLAVRERINKVKDLMEELKVKNKDFYQTAELSVRQSDDLFPDSNIEKFTDTYTLSQLIYGLYAQKNARNRLAFMFGDLVTQDDKAALNHNNDLIYDLGMKRNDRFVKQAEAILEKHPKLKQVAEAIVSDWQDMNNKTRLNQVMIDEYNQGLDMEEFYMPIKRLDFNGTSLAQSIADDVFNQNAGKNRTTPKKGFTKARFDITPDQQMRTNMDFLELWLNSVDEQEHLIATNAYVRKLNRVFKGRGNNDLRSAIENVYGKHINEDIDKYINEIANPPATMEDRNVSKWIRFLRGRLYEAYLGFKLSSFVLQVITSPAPFLREVNAIQLSEYILKVMAKPSEYWKFIAERSPMMESRSIDPMLADIKKEAEDATANKFVRGYRKTLAFGTGLLEIADRWMVSAGWLACFEKAMNERQEAIENGDITQLQAEVEASRYADEVVLESQPTGDSTELSPMFKTRSAAWQALTQFTTSLNVIWTNLMYDSISDLRNRNFKRAILTAFAYALAGTVLYAVQDYEPPEDDEHWIKDTILKLLYGMTSQGVSSVPLLGSGIEKFSKQLFTGEKQLMTQRVFPAFEATREALERLAQGKMDEKAVRKAIEAIGLFTGLPVSGTKELEHIFRDRNGNWRYKGKRITDNDILNWIMAEKWQSVVGRRDNYGNKQRRK